MPTPRFCFGSRLPVCVLTVAAAWLTAGCDESPDPFGYPGPESGVSLLDGGTPAPDGPGWLDAGPPRRDGEGPRLDGEVPRLDGEGPSPDGGGVGPDGAPPKPDAGSFPPLYPAARRHAPLSAHVVQRLRKVVGQHPGKDNRVFSKVGNSITVSTNFLNCFAGSGVNLTSAHQSLAPTVSHFNKTIAGSTSSWDRKSLAATVGWSAWSAIKGSPSPVDQEISAVSPRLAVVMFGSNDVEGKAPFTYANNMLDLVDRLLGKGVIPLLSSVPPRDDKPSSDALIPTYNDIVRGIAQGRLVPHMDYHGAMLPLPKHGLSGDKLHPNAYWTSGGSKACDFSQTGLQYGYNTRNLLVLEALDRVRRAVLGGAAAPDPPGTALAGQGSAGNPFVINKLPFTDMRSTKGGAFSAIATYPGCSATQDESGPEYVYRLVVTSTTKVTAMVFDRGTVDIDLHLLGATVSGQSCIKRAHQELSATLQPGTYHFVLDTFVDSGGKQLAGEYLFLLRGT